MGLIKRMIKALGVLVATSIGIGFIVSRIERAKGEVGWVEGHRAGFYERNVKRALDFGLSLFALAVLWPVMAVTALLVRTKLGKPVLFKQERPGLGGRSFVIRKFRTMRDGEGSDAERLTEFGKKLRRTSIDELPELINILNGSMSIVGPRPQLVRDMVFMSARHRRRHDVRPGLTGLAQVNGRNGVGWEHKLDTDLEYIDSITFLKDIKIVIRTVGKTVREDGINADGQATALDYGDWLLANGKVNQEVYEENQKEAKRLLNEIAEADI